VPATPDDLFARLDALGVAYTLYPHPAVHTVAESSAVTAHIPGLHCRNLFLRDKRGAQLLLTVGNATRVDLKRLAAHLGTGRLSFGSPERLMEALGTTPGSVSPFAVLHDAARAVTPLLDAAMLGAYRVAVHPLVNTATITLAPQDLVRFIEACHSPPRVITFPL
jgi:Ala-tRNA(Pro) deacylase